MSDAEGFAGLGPDPDLPRPPVSPVEPEAKKYPGIGAAARANAVARAEQSRRSLHTFIRAAWPIVEPRHEFVDNWHIREVCRELEAIARGEFPLAPDGAPADGVVINVPPGTSKTLVVSVNWPSWVWASDPARRFLVATYSLARTVDANNAARKVVESDWYREAFPAVELRLDQNVKLRFDTTAQGWRIGTTVGGEGTGLHPDFTIIDDALSADDARSEVKRKAAVDWWEGTISTRGITRKTFVIHIAQRLHEDDLAGVMLRTRRYHHIRFPMRYEAEKPEGQRPRSYFVPDHRDPRREEGELLWPVLIPQEKVDAIARTLGPEGDAGQFQQRPAPIEGSMFKRTWFKIVEALPAKIEGDVRFWDVAGTEGGKGARTAGVRMVKCGGLFVLLNSKVDRLSPAGVDDLILQTARLDGRSVMVREEQEPGSSGKAVCAARATLLAGFDYLGIPSTGDKEVRARPLRAQAEAGNVALYAPAGFGTPEWIEEFLSEVVLFPNGSVKDQVDAASSAFNVLTGGDATASFEVLW